MLGAREPRHRRMSIDPASIQLGRRFLLLAFQPGDCEGCPSPEEIDRLSGWDVIQQAEPLIYYAPGEDRAPPDPDSAQSRILRRRLEQAWRLDSYEP